MPFTRRGPFSLNNPPTFDNPAWLNALELGIIEAQSQALEASQQTGAFTFALAQAGLVVPVSHATGATATVPPASSVAWLEGAVLGALQVGAGAITLAAGSGVTIVCRGKTAPFLTAGQWAEVWLRRRGTTDTWVLTGDVA